MRVRAAWGIDVDMRYVPNTLAVFRPWFATIVDISSGDYIIIFPPPLPFKTFQTHPCVPW